MQDRILTDAPGGAELFTLSERGFHLLRKRPDWPLDAEVRLGLRCVRFRVDVLRRYAAELAAGSASMRQPEPERLRRVRERKQKAPRRAAERPDDN